MIDGAGDGREEQQQSFDNANSKKATTFSSQENVRTSSQEGQDCAEGPATSAQRLTPQERLGVIGDFSTLSLSPLGSFPRVCFLEENGLFLALPAPGWRQLFALFCSCG